MGYTCAKCSEPLIRVTQSDSDGFVICPVCLASGGFKQVIEQGAGLVKKPIDAKLVEMIDKVWIANKLGSK